MSTNELVSSTILIFSTILLIYHRHCKHRLMKTIEMDRLLATTTQNTFSSGKLLFFPTSWFVMFFMLLVGQQIIFVTSDAEVCNTVDTVTICPDNTCCRQSLCDALQVGTICCTDITEKNECSNCPACGKCIGVINPVSLLIS